MSKKSSNLAGGQSSHGQPIKFNQHKKKPMDEEAPLILLNQSSEDDLRKATSKNNDCSISANDRKAILEALRSEKLAQSNNSNRQGNDPVALKGGSIGHMMLEKTSRSSTLQNLNSTKSTIAEKFTSLHLRSHHEEKAKKNIPSSDKLNKRTKNEFVDDTSDTESEELEEGEIDDDDEEEAKKAMVTNKYRNNTRPTVSCSLLQYSIFK